MCLHVDSKRGLLKDKVLGPSVVIFPLIVHLLYVALVLVAHFVCDGTKQFSIQIIPMIACLLFFFNENEVTFQVDPHKQPLDGVFHI